MYLKRTPTIYFMTLLYRYRHLNIIQLKKKLDSKIFFNVCAMEFDKIILARLFSA